MNTVVEVCRQPLFSQWFASPLGDIVAVADDTHLRVLSFFERKSEVEDRATLSRYGQGEVRPEGNSVTSTIGQELEAYFAGESSDFSVPLSPAGSEFEKAVWSELLKVPLAETCSYGDIARNVGGMETVRAVGKANGANPIVIVIPCHRCIGSDGSLVGYGAGLWRKKWLLRHEGKMRPVGLFAL
ncbi:methylated-DNA--[protein]-cysteine S-methyltransferase [Ciceribacter sp. L1K23]|uniref:methylated-DNA--[protein]-cysteine S-methyltransferase n=1 Tax=Ciceribacter sp. L1K23 TaxID=2820276 RepID=UPI001B80F4C5|nr:methylated-DNA--[protein]-cysteine S-methyltransferase [Ciceribacter sp. L1K23]MBR0557155.1 methylated-DNA--[protein]-cysteine S-methyltransferase [Ciceribacter sp. L1K23]